MSHEGTNRVRLALWRAAVLPRALQQSLAIKGRKVYQGIHLQVAPDVFDGIEFWRIGRQKMGVESFMTGKKLTGGLGAVGLKPVPNQDDEAGEFTQEHAKKIDNRMSIHIGVGVEPEIQPNSVPRGRHAECRDDGYLLVSARALVKQRRFAPWTP